MNHARMARLAPFFRLLIFSAFIVYTPFALAEPDDFGLPNGTRAEGTAEALRALDRDHPATVEIYMSYAATRRRFGGNPFGHVAIRIGDTVYTANQNAVRGEDPQILVSMSADEYFYGVKPPTQHATPGSNYGVAYARDTVGLRLNGVSAEAVKKMLAQIAEEEKVWQSGERPFHWSRNNCVNFTDRILRAAGMKVQNDPSPVALPPDYFFDALTYFTKQPGIEASVVRYARLPTPKPELRYSHVPVTPHRPGYFLESMFRRLTGKAQDVPASIANAAIVPGTGISVETVPQNGPRVLTPRNLPPGMRFDRTFGTLCKQGFSMLAELMR